MKISAMIFTAGYGNRLKPLTDAIPKPLLPIGNSCCLTKILSSLKALRISKIVVNAFHLKDKIVEFCKDDHNIIVVVEDQLLETGGGLFNALPYLSDTILAINGDIWIQDDYIFKKMIETFNAHRLDNLLLLIPKENALFYEGKGDYYGNDYVVQEPFLIDHKHNLSQEEAPYIYGGIQMWRKSALLDFKPSKSHFSMKEIFDYYNSKNALYGMIYESKWCDIGTLKAYEGLQNYTEK